MESDNIHTIASAAIVTTTSSLSDASSSVLNASHGPTAIDANAMNASLEQGVVKNENGNKSDDDDANSNQGPGEKIIYQNSAKLFIQNLGMKITRKDFEKQVAKAKEMFPNDYMPEVFRIRKQPKSDWATVNFDSVEDRDKALLFLSKLKNRKGEMLNVYVDNKADTMPFFKATDTDGTKTAQQAVSPLQDIPYETQLSKKQSEMANVVKNITRSLRLLEIGRKVPKEKIPSWLTDPNAKVQSPDRYYLDPILPSPCIDGYRNKCDFTVGVDYEDKICVGFRLGNFKDGSVRVGDPEPCKTVPEAAKLVAKIVRDFIDKSKYAPFDIVKKTGAWRGVHVRTSYKTKQVLISLNVNIEAKPKDENDSLSNLENEMQELSRILQKSAPLDNLALVGILIYESTSAAHQVTLDQAKPRVLFGNDYLVEELLDLKFQISPEAFFQVNTLGADTMFNVVREAALADISRPCTVLDVCCGTGVIGLLMVGKDRADQVIGIELSPFAIEDAKRNATFNNLSDKSHFLCSRAETVMSELLEHSGEWTGWRRSKREPQNNDATTAVGAENSSSSSLAASANENNEAESALKKQKIGDSTASESKAASSTNDDEEDDEDDKVEGDKNNENSEYRKTIEKIIETLQVNNKMQELVAIVDPPRAGLHRSVIKALRHARAIKRVIYISCNPTGSFKQDALSLCRTSIRRGAPFRPIKSIPVDMFPHTEHCELITIFVRDSEPRYHGEKDESEEEGENGESNSGKRKRSWNRA